MRYIIVIFMALILALTVGTVHADGWAPPATCDDDQREIKGNRTSPCKFPKPELENIEYRVRMEYPKCYGELRIYIKDAGPLAGGYTMQGVEIRDKRGKLHGWKSKSLSWSNTYPHLYDGYIAYNLNEWNLRSIVDTNRSLSKREPGTPIYARVFIGDTTETRIAEYKSDTIPYPSLPGAYENLSMINACLSQLEHEAIQREANRRATISAQELIALHQEKIQTAENEILRTQAFIAELEFREAAGVILQEIAKIRLAGKADRVKLLNEHLERVRQSSAEFDIETSEIESIIQQYIDFNEALLAEINGYQTTLQQRINDATRDIANQQAELEALEERAREISVGDGN